MGSNGASGYKISMKIRADMYALNYTGCIGFRINILVLAKANVKDIVRN